MAGYRHGIYISERPTSLIPPVTVDSAMPVFFVVAPVHLAKNPYAITHVPKLCYKYDEAAEAFGFSMRKEIWTDYTACEAIYSQFVLYSCAPVVFVNILDPKTHKIDVTDEILQLDGYSGVLNVDGVLIDTVKVLNDEGMEYEIEKHFTLAFNADGFVEINAKKDADDGIGENTEVKLSYTKLAPEMVDIYDVIGGYDAQTGKKTGLELVNDIYPLFTLVPGQIVAPGFSGDPAVAAVMETKAANINGHFRCVAINDVPTFTDDSGEIVPIRYTDAPAWKNNNNYISERQINCWPCARLGEQIFHLSTQLAGLICRTDAENSSIPYNSPSNKGLKINGLCDILGDEIVLGVEQANYLNGQGIVTAINFTNGWVAWGNRTGAYPGITDAKDAFVPIRRMFDWIANSIVLTYWSKIDYPLTRRTIKSIVDSINYWFNGLMSREFILGGRIEFLEDDNPVTDMIDGIARFKVSIAPPPPLKEAEFILEYDPAYLQTLFAKS